MNKHELCYMDIICFANFLFIGVVSAIYGLNCACAPFHSSFSNGSQPTSKVN